MKEYMIVYRHGDFYKKIKGIYGEDNAYMVLTMVIKAGYTDSRIEEVIKMEPTKNIEIADNELRTIIWAVGNEYHRTVRRRVERGTSEPTETERRLLEIDKKLYEILTH